MMLPFRIVNHALSPGGQAGRLAIMIFHRVLREPDPLMPDQLTFAAFESRMSHVREWFNVIALDEAVDRLVNGTLPPRALAITFDDGYADNFDIALPILMRLGLPATFFIATGFLDGGCMWNDIVIETVRHCSEPSLDLRDLGLGCIQTRTFEQRRAAIHCLIDQLKYRAVQERRDLAERIARIAGAEVPTHLMMTREQIRGLIGSGMGIGAHTHNHPILARLDSFEAREEIAKSKSLLEDLIGEPIRLFAYPNGKPEKDYTVENVQQVRDLGFIAAFSTATGVASAVSDLLQLPRFTPWNREPWRFGAQLSANLRHVRHAVA